MLDTNGIFGFIKRALLNRKLIYGLVIGLLLLIVVVIIAYWIYANRKDQTYNHVRQILNHINLDKTIVLVIGDEKSKNDYYKSAHFVGSYEMYTAHYKSGSTVYLQKFEMGAVVGLDCEDQMESFLLNSLLDLIKDKVKRDVFINSILAIQSTDIRTDHLNSSVAVITKHMKINLPLYFVFSGLEQFVGMQEIFKGQQNILTKMFGYSVEAGSKKIDRVVAHHCMSRVRESLLKMQILDSSINKLPEEIAREIFVIKNLFENTEAMLDRVENVIRIEGSINFPSIRGVYIGGMFEVFNTIRFSFIHDLFYQKIFMEQGLVFGGVFKKDSRRKWLEALVFLLLTVSIGNLGIEYYGYRVESEKHAVHLKQVFVDSITRETKTEDAIEHINEVMLDFEGKNSYGLGIFYYFNKFYRTLGLGIDDAIIQILERCMREIIDELSKHYYAMLEITTTTYEDPQTALMVFIKKYNDMQHQIEILNKMYANRDVGMLYVVYESIFNKKMARQVYDPTIFSKFIKQNLVNLPFFDQRQINKHLNNLIDEYFSLMAQNNPIDQKARSLIRRVDECFSKSIYDIVEVQQIYLDLEFLKEVTAVGLLDKDTTNNIVSLSNEITRSKLQKDIKRKFFLAKDSFLKNAKQSITGLQSKILGPVIKTKSIQTTIEISEPFLNLYEDLKNIFSLELTKYNLARTTEPAPIQFEMPHSISIPDFKGLFNDLAATQELVFVSEKISHFLKRFIKHQIQMRCKLGRKDIFSPSEIRQSSYLEMLTSELEDILDLIVELKEMEEVSRIEIPTLAEIYALVSQALIKIDSKFEDPMPIYKKNLDTWDGKPGLANLILKNRDSSIYDFVTEKISVLAQAAEKAKVCIDCMIIIDPASSLENEMLTKWRDLYEYSVGTMENGVIDIYIGFLEAVNTISIDNLDVDIRMIDDNSFFGKKTKEIFECMSEALLYRSIIDATDRWQAVKQAGKNMEKSPYLQISDAINFIQAFSELTTKDIEILGMMEGAAESLAYLTHCYETLSNIVDVDEETVVLSIIHTPQQITSIGNVLHKYYLNDGENEVDLLEVGRMTVVLRKNSGFSVQMTANPNIQIFKSDEMKVEENNLSLEFKSYQHFLQLGQKMHKKAKNSHSIAITFDCVIFFDGELNKYLKTIPLDFYGFDGSTVDIGVLFNKTKLTNAIAAVQ